MRFVVIVVILLLLGGVALRVLRMLRRKNKPKS